MNPELLRNMWVELTERRVTLMVVIVACILLVAISPGDWSSAAFTAELVFYAVVVVWGTRCAAQSVVEEIGNKTAIFGAHGLGLDSVDALQLVVALEKHFGLKIADSAAAKGILENVETIAAEIEKSA